MLKQLINEIKIQALLKHPNIIQLYDFFHDKGKIYLFMELGTDGHLFDLLAVKGKFEEETTSIITREIIQGIDYMHQKLIIHRDIKLENIVFTMVLFALFREWLKFVILDGPSTNPNSLGPPSVELLFTSPQRSSLAKNTTKKLTSGLSAPSLTS